MIAYDSKITALNIVNVCNMPGVLLKFFLAKKTIKNYIKQKKQLILILSFNEIILWNLSFKNLNYKHAKND